MLCFVLKSKLDFIIFNKLRIENLREREFSTILEMNMKNKQQNVYNYDFKLNTIYIPN